MLTHSHSDGDFPVYGQGEVTCCVVSYFLLLFGTNSACLVCKCCCLSLCVFYLVP